MVTFFRVFYCCVVDIFSTLLLWRLQPFFGQLISCSEGISLKSNFLLSSVLALAENGQSLIHKDPDQPTAKRTLVLEPGWIPRRSHPAVFNDAAGSFRTAENSTSDEVQ